jgi:hypothetical protein
VCVCNLDDANGGESFSQSYFFLLLRAFMVCIQIHKPIIFSTSPHAKYTHWKQTVFYLSEPLTVCAGEEINGEIQCRPNSKNPRDLDIDIKYTFSNRHVEVDMLQHFRLR